MAFTTVDNPELYFQAKTYTGNASTLAVTFDGSENMQPDWLWLKKTEASGHHFVFDSVRGVDKELNPSTNDEESSPANYVSSFDTNGFTIGSDTDINPSGGGAVAWAWKAGTSFSNDASATSVGTIDSSGSRNSTAGISIITYTGNQSAATIAHGLGALPGMLIIKNRTSTDSRDWAVYHKNLTGNNKYFSLNLSSAELTDAATFNNTAPTTTVFSSASSVEVNESGKTFIAYCFTGIKGYSRFGFYTGNGNADGPFVYTGFRPAFLLFKGNNTSDWQLFDNKRDPENPVEQALHPDIINVASTDQELDFLSNGFKLRDTGAHVNGDGVNFIYMAFAESPFVNSNGIPTNAR